MGRLFEDSWKRIDRALMHGKSFTQQWNRLFNPEASSVETYRKDEGTWISKMVFPSIPENDLAIELGEFFYQLMAALDGVVFQATMLHGETDTPTNIESLYFPIAKTSVIT